MKEKDLDLMLGALGKNPLPNLPGNFRQNVWREIHQRQQQKVLGWQEGLEEMLSFFLRPNPVLASLALALIVGMIATMPLNQQTKSARTSTALALEVFAPEAQSSGIWKNLDRK